MLYIILSIMSKTNLGVHGFCWGVLHDIDLETNTKKRIDFVSKQLGWMVSLSRSRCLRCL